MKEVSTSIKAVLVALLLLLVITQAFAQLGTGTILGTVKDPAGAVVPGATITITNTATGAKRTSTTSNEGYYRAPALPAGTYQLEVSHEGFATAVEKGVVLAVGQDLTVNLSLKIGSISEKVEVTGEAALVDTTTSSLGSLVSEQKIADLPLNGRNYVDLTLLQPGVTQQTQVTAGQGATGTMYSSNGAPTRSNNVMIDGTPMQSAYGLNTSSVAGTTLGLDGVKEYKVVTSLFSAEYGTTMGSQTTIVSKSGGNSFHGDVFEYLRNAALDARNYFDPRPEVLSGKRIPAFRRNQFGAALGGPIKMDKTFFFANYEGLRQTRGNPLYVPVGTTFPKECWDAPHQIKTIGNPCAMFVMPPLGIFNFEGRVDPKVVPFANLYAYPNVGNNQFVYPTIEKTREDFGQIRVDHNFGAADSFFARYTIDDALVDKPDSYPQFFDRVASRMQYATLNENHIFSTSLLNTARLSFARTNLSQTTFTSDPATAAAQLVPGCGGGDQQCMVGLLVVPPLATLGPGTVAPGYAILNVLGIADDLFWTKGKNAIKMGFLVNHYEDPLYNNLIFGSVNILPTIGTLGSPAGDLFLNGYAIGQSWQQQNNPVAGTKLRDTYRNFTWWTVGGYFQDDYRATSRLTLNLGLRYEFATVPWEKTGKNYNLANRLTGSVTDCYHADGSVGPSCLAQPGGIWKNPTTKNFSPRIGIAWDMFGTGKTSLKAGYGIYYDVANWGSMLGQQSLSVPPLASINNLFANTPGPPFWHFTVPHPVFTAPFCSPENMMTGIDCLTPQLTGIDYNAKTFYLQQYNITIQQQLPAGIALSAAYVGSRGIHLRRALEGNPVVPCNYPGATPSPGCSDGGINRAAVPWSDGMNPVWDPTLAPWNSPIGRSGRFNPNLAALVFNGFDGDSYYNALQVSVTKPFAKRLQFQTAFTWSKTLDTTQGDIASADEGSNTPSNPFNSRFDKGPTAMDAPLNLRFNAIYNFPDISSKGFFAGLVKGWRMANIVSAQSGYPFSCMMQTGSNPSNNELGVEDIGGNLSNDRCDLVTSDNLAWAQAHNPNSVVYDPNTVIVGNQKQWFNPNMFTIPKAGFLGNSGRGMMRGPSLVTWDMSFIKSTKLGFLGEAGGLEFRAEIFNILNHTNFAFPFSVNYNSSYQAISSAGTVVPGAGEITNTLVNARQIQVALKIEF
jgi:hypothetical protein